MAIDKAAHPNKISILFAILLKPSPLLKPIHMMSNCSFGKYSMKDKSTLLLTIDLNIELLPKLHRIGIPIIPVSITVFESKPSIVPTAM